MLQKKIGEKDPQHLNQPLNAPSFSTSTINMPHVDTNSNNELSNDKNDDKSDADVSSNNKNVLPVSSICCTDTTLAMLSVTCLRFNIEVVAKARASGCVHAVSTYTILFPK